MALWALLAGCRPSEADPDPLDAGALHDATFALTSIGPRQVATPEEGRAEAWIQRRLEGLGLAEVRKEPFSFDAWRPGTASVKIDREVPVEALSPSPATDVTLTLRASSEPFAGSAVVMSSEDGSRADEFVSAVTGGASALIRVTEDLDLDGSPLVEVGHTLDGTQMPSIAVDRPTGDWIRSHLGQEARLRIAPLIVPDHTSYDVYARVAGRAGQTGKVYVLGHYDSWHPSECAFDNALGAGALVELAARAASGPRPDRDIVFLATSGEEQGLRGSLAWVEAHQDEIGPMDFVLVLDVMWSAEGSYLALATDDALRTEAMAAAEAEGLDVDDGGQPGLGSDHVPFVARGAGAVWLGRWPDRHYHTVADTIDSLDFDDAAAALRTNWRLIAAHAGIPRG